MRLHEIQQALEALGIFDLIKKASSGTTTVVQGAVSSVQSFLQLTDVPSSYEGQQGKVLIVKTDETGLEYGEMTGGEPTVPAGNQGDLQMNDGGAFGASGANWNPDTGTMKIGNSSAILELGVPETAISSDGNNLYLTGAEVQSNGSKVMTASDLSAVATSGDHADLSNVGSNTHEQIDTHIADTAKHVSPILTIMPKGTGSMVMTQLATAFATNTTMGVGLMHIPSPITVNKITIRSLTKTTNGTILIGVWTEDGQTQLISTSVTVTANNTAYTATLGSPVLLVQGNYWFGILPSGTASTQIACFQNAPSGFNAISGEPTIEGTYTTTASTLPTTITIASITASNAYTPLIRLDN